MDSSNLASGLISFIPGELFANLLPSKKRLAEKTVNETTIFLSNQKVNKHLRNSLSLVNPLSETSPFFNPSNYLEIQLLRPLFSLLKNGSERLYRLNPQRVQPLISSNKLYWSQKLSYPFQALSALTEQVDSVKHQVFYKLYNYIPSFGKTALIGLERFNEKAFYALTFLPKLTLPLLSSYTYDKIQENPSIKNRLSNNSITLRIQTSFEETLNNTISFFPKELSDEESRTQEGKNLEELNKTKLGTNKLAAIAFQTFVETTKLSEKADRKFCQELHQEEESKLLHKIHHYAEQQQLPSPEINDIFSFLCKEKFFSKSAAELKAIFEEIWRNCAASLKEEEKKEIEEIIEKLPSNVADELGFVYRLKFSCQKLLDSQTFRFIPPNIAYLKRSLLLARLTLPKEKESPDLKRLFNPQIFLEKASAIYLHDSLYPTFQEKFLSKELDAFSHILGTSLGLESKDLLQTLFSSLIQEILLNRFSDPHNLVVALLCTLGIGEEKINYDSFGIGKDTQKHLRENGKDLLKALKDLREQKNRSLDETEAIQNVDGKFESIKMKVLPPLDPRLLEAKEKALANLIDVLKSKFSQAWGIHIEKEVNKREPSISNFEKLKQVPFIGTLAMILHKIIEKIYLITTFLFTKDKTLPFFQFVFKPEILTASEKLAKSLATLTQKDDWKLRHLCFLGKLHEGIRNPENIKGLSFEDSETLHKTLSIAKTFPFLKKRKFLCKGRIFQCITYFTSKLKIPSKCQKIYRNFLAKQNPSNLLSFTSRSIKKISLENYVINHLKFGSLLKDFPESADLRKTIALFLNEHIKNHLKEVWGLLLPCKEAPVIEEYYIDLLLSSPSPLEIIQSNDLNAVKLIQERLIQEQIKNFIEIEAFTRSLIYSHYQNDSSRVQELPLKIKESENLIFKLKLLEKSYTKEGPFQQSLVETSRHVITQTTTLLKQALEPLEELQTLREGQANKQKMAIREFHQITFGERTDPNLSKIEKLNYAIASLENYLEQLQAHPNEMTISSARPYFQTVHAFKLKTLGRLIDFNIQNPDEEIQNIQQNLAFLKQEKEKAEQLSQEILSSLENSIQDFTESIRMDDLMLSPLIFKHSKDLDFEVKTIDENLVLLNEQREVFLSRFRESKEKVFENLLQENERDTAKLIRKKQKRLQHFQTISSKTQKINTFILKLSLFWEKYKKIKPLENLFDKALSVAEEARSFRELVLIPLEHLQKQNLEENPFDEQAKECITSFYLERFSKKSGIKGERIEDLEDELKDLEEVYQKKAKKHYKQTFRIRKLNDSIEASEKSLAYLQNNQRERERRLQLRQNRSGVNKRLKNYDRKCSCYFRTILNLQTDNYFQLTYHPSLKLPLKFIELNEQPLREIANINENLSFLKMMKEQEEIAFQRTSSKIKKIKTLQKLYKNFQAFNRLPISPNEKTLIPSSIRRRIQTPIPPIRKKSPPKKMAIRKLYLPKKAKNDDLSSIISDFLQTFIFIQYLQASVNHPGTVHNSNKKNFFPISNRELQMINREKKKTHKNKMLRTSSKAQFCSKKIKH